jgi:predicted hotdog family 3-hydroxylacyl-ACP dehydratase
MCLIDAALEVTDDGIVCMAHIGLAGHPLGEAQGVPALHSVEYGAQAAALHHLARTHEQGAVSGGLLLQIRDLQVFVDYLDRLPQPMRISAHCMIATSETARYVFEMRAGDVLASCGELTLRLT